MYIFSLEILLPINMGWKDCYKTSMFSIFNTQDLFSNTMLNHYLSQKLKPIEKDKSNHYFNNNHMKKKIEVK